MLRRATCLAAFALAAFAGTARSAPGLLVGVTEDGLKFEPRAAAADARALGITAFRITLRWRPGLTAPTAAQANELGRATRSVGNLTLVLSVFGERAIFAPTTAEGRNAYCTFLQRIVDRYERIRYITIWNEPNKTFFWTPQFNEDGSSAAPAAYEKLLARCWDVLHEARSDVQVIAPSTAPRGNDNPAAVSNVSHSPTLFVRELGRAYRESGREAPIFDIVGHHVHGIHSAERPWRQHPGSGVAQGDLDKLENAFAAAFAGTSQPVPGRCVEERCASVWWLEAGFQTKPPQAKASLYRGFEISPRPLPDAVGPVDLEPLPPGNSLAPDQATQIVAAVRLAYCQPHVTAFFNFLLWDERRLEGWQAAPYWVDRTRKASWPAFRRAIREVESGDVDCDGLVPVPRETAGATAPRTTTTNPNEAPPPAPPGQAAPPPQGDEPGDGGSSWGPVALAAGAIALGAAALGAFLRRRSARRGAR